MVGASQRRRDVGEAEDLAGGGIQGRPTSGSPLRQCCRSRGRLPASCPSLACAALAQLREGPCREEAGGRGGEGRTPLPPTCLRVPGRLGRTRLWVLDCVTVALAGHRRFQKRVDL